MTNQVPARSPIAVAAAAIAHAEPDLTEAQAASAIRRQLDPEFPRWLRLAQGAGY